MRAPVRIAQVVFALALSAFERPGAERNARIFSKLSHVAEPGDRVIVVFGAGHACRLRELMQRTPGYTLIEPIPHLMDRALAD